MNDARWLLQWSRFGALCWGARSLPIGGAAEGPARARREHAGREHAQNPLTLASVAARRFSASAKRTSLNADLAEGYGPWTMTADEDLLQIVTTANVACGGHAGDANIMAAVLERAAVHGVSVGAHPGYDDKPGFGRRVLKMELDEIEHLIAYQVGALLGVAAMVRARRAAAGGAAAEVTHVKPHGALNNLACVDASVAAAITRGVAGVDPGLIMLAPVRAALASMRP